ncbi:MAG: glycosyltransferase family 39 protein [Nevskia sp.]|nr:glycosyltransferase family 39 protein [Nevskia sp.]
MTEDPRPRTGWPAPGLAWLLLALAAVTAYRALALRWAGLDLYVDEAQYWTWSRRLDWGFYSKPPVIAALIRLTTSACGDGPACVKSGALLVYPLASLLIWAIARRLFDARIAFWSALTFFLLPGVSFSSQIISTDVPFFLFWCAALYAYLRALDGDRWGWWLAAGAAAGLGLLTKYTMLIFALSVLLHLALTPRLRPQLRNPRLYAAMATALGVFAPNLLWNARHGWPTVHHTVDISHLDSDAGLHWNHLGEFLASQLAVMGPLLFCAWLWLTAWRPRQWWADERYRLLACFALPFLALISLQALAGRADANWGAMTYAAATIFAVALLLQRGRRRLLAAAILVNAALMPLLYHFDAATRALQVELSARTDPFKRVRGWAELGRQAQAVRAQFPGTLYLADSRDILAELMYYVHPHPLDAVLWNPQRVMDNDYALSTRMDDQRGRDFLYVTGRAQLDAATIDSFQSVEELPPLHVTIHRDYALDYKVFLLHNFGGYR